MGPAHLIEAHHPEHGPVGYAEIREKDGPGGAHVEVSRLWTTREHRGTGIGSALLGEAERHYKGREMRLKPWPEDDEVEEDDPDYQDEGDLRQYYRNRGFRDMPGSHDYMTKQAVGYAHQQADHEDPEDDEENYDACYYCQREHNPHEHEEQQSFVPEWDQVLHDVHSIHRVLPLKLPEREHALVHDPATPPGHAADAILRHVAEAHADQGHMHWTSQDGLEHNKATFGGLGHDTTTVVLHARKPDEGDIEDDPSSLIENQVHPYGHPEYEVPIAPGADVHLTGVSWAHARTGGWGGDGRWHEGPEQDWHHHELGQPMRVEASGRWQPSTGIFAPTTGLDRRLFDGRGRLRPAVRIAIMARLDRALRAEARLVDDDWHEYLRVYLAGGSASEWAGSRPNEGAQDLDVLIGVDYESARSHSQALSSLDDQQADVALNAALRSGFNESAVILPGVDGTWDLTGYVNHAAYDVRAIKPYAAYDVSGMSWAVRPPHLPGHTLADFNSAVLAQARALAAEARAILRMPEPLRTREARALWERVHAERSQAFSDAGEGWTDPGNVAEKWLAYAPGNLLGRVRELALAKTAASDPLVLYHGAHHEDVPSIVARGLRPSDTASGWTVTDDFDGAAIHAERKDWTSPRVVELHVPAGQAADYLGEPSDATEGTVYALRRPLPAAWVRQVHEVPPTWKRQAATGEPGSKTAFLANVEGMNDRGGRRPYYHGTAARLAPGAEVDPRPTPWLDQRTPRTFFTSSLERASVFGHLKATGDPHEVHVYEVEPTGPHEPDPVAGLGAFRSESPLRVLREVEPHPFLSEFCGLCRDKAALPPMTAAHAPEDEPLIRTSQDIHWTTEEWAAARREPWHAASKLAQEEVRRSHPALTRPFPKGDEGDEMAGHVFRHVGLPEDIAATAFVARHPNPERLVSNPSWINGRPGVALHPAKWDYGTFIHEAAHHKVMYDNAIGPSEHQPDEQTHGPEWGRAYAAGLNRLSRHAGDDFLHHQQRFRGMIDEGLQWVRPRDLDAADEHHRLMIAEGSRAAGEVPSAGIRVIGAEEKPTKGKDEVNYREADDLSRRCGTCVMVRESPGGAALRCALVRGLIDSDDVCDEWYPAKGATKEQGSLEPGAVTPTPIAPVQAASGYSGLTGRSAMIYLDLPEGAVRQVKGGVDDHHVTIVYLGKNVGDEAFAEACRRARAAAAQTAPLSGFIGGIDTFEPSDSSDGKVPAFVPAYLPGVGELRRKLEDLSGSEHRQYRPHVTLGYYGEDEDLPGDHPTVPVAFTRLHVKRGDDITSFPFAGAPAPVRKAAAQDGTFYHGSHHDIPPGAEVTPDGANEAGRRYMQSGEKHVFYTDDPGLARTYGPNVYRVEPLAPATGRGRDRKRLHDPEPGFPREYEYLSSRGVRVVEKVGEDEARQAMNDRTARRWRSRGGQETIRRIIDRGDDLPPSAVPHYRTGAVSAPRPAYYHGSGRRYREGDLIDPATPHKKVHQQSDPSKVYFSDSPWNAQRWGDVASRSGQGYAYEVEPTGEHEEDPHYSGDEERGCYDLSASPPRRVDVRRTGAPLRVIRKLPRQD